MVTSAIDNSIRAFYEKNEPITIETEDLNLRSIQESDKPAYQVLFSDKETMMKYAGTEARLKEIDEETWQKEQQEKIATRVDTLVKRWKEKDPFSAFAIFHKETKAFVGHVVVGHGDKPGEASLAYVIAKEEWKKGYGTQAIEAIVKKYLPALIKIHQECYGKPLQIEGGAFSELTATARLDNVYSIKILEKVDMIRTGEREESGSLRAVFSKTYLNRA